MTKIIVYYLALVGLLGHLVVVFLFVKYPDIKYKAENKIYSLISDRVLKKRDVHDDIFSAFGVWKPNVTKNFKGNKLLIGSREFSNIQAAFDALKPGDVLEIGPGVYKAAGTITQNNVSVVGRGHVVFDGGSVQGKGAFVVKGDDVRIENIECKGIRVDDGNGACVRLEGANLTLEHVYFHDSEQGVLTGNKPGIVKINASRFELLGKSGRAHGVYMGDDGELYIANSLFVAAVDEGHEIKSRARVTEIVKSTVASMGSNDSRLIDISNGGVFRISDSVMEKGYGSVNSDLIGYGLEGVKHKYNQVDVKNNLIIMERVGVNNLVHAKEGSVVPDVVLNVIISKIEPDFSSGNVWYDDRKGAGLKEYPFVPYTADN